MARGCQEGLSATSLGVRPRGSFGLPDPTMSPRLRFKLFPDMLALYTMMTCIIRSPGCGKSRGKPEKGLGKSVLPPGMNRPESVKLGRRQTRLAVRFVGGVPIDRDGIFVRG
ncbi:hypothetical protein CRG98_015612 [Punica granatum]|uniref:Uncharacterized protein n=1 Tax=Punica granatum TaxID=22663 RepID=A0A2I0K622_PUNGR|nr:hypothetical protein CRG98_015612 [Punica granatum]